MVSVLIASMTASIILLSACTRRVFPVEIFLGRYIAPVSAMFFSFPVHRPFVLPSFVCGLLLGWYCLADGPENVHFVRFADVATGNSFIDDTNGFVHALVVCCGPVTTFAGSKFLFCIAFGTEFLAVGCLVLNSIGTLLVVVCGVDGVFEKGRFPTVAHAFVNGTAVGFLLHCLTVGVFGAGVCEVFALFSTFGFVGQSLLVVTCSCPHLTHFSVRVCCPCTGWMRGPPSSYPSLWSSVSPSSISSSWRTVVPPRLVIVVLPLYLMGLPLPLMDLSSINIFRTVDLSL